MGKFQRNRLAECLAAQASLCERMAAACWDEERAQQFRRLARECREGAAQEQASPTQAHWPDSLGAKSRAG
jgi:hypothetical protein